MSSKKYPRIKDFSEIGKRIRSIRGSLTQKAFADIFGVNQNTVSRWEKGTVLSDEETINKIADYGGVTVEWLRHGDQAAPQLTEHAPAYDASPLSPTSEAALTEVIAAVEDYYARHRLKRRPIQKARLIIRLYQHYAETREKPDDILIKGNLPLAD